MFRGTDEPSGKKATMVLQVSSKTDVVVKEQRGGAGRRVAAGQPQPLPLKQQAGQAGLHRIRTLNHTTTTGVLGLVMVVRRCGEPLNATYAARSLATKVTKRTRLSNTRYLSILIKLGILHLYACPKVPSQANVLNRSCYVLNDIWTTELLYVYKSRVAFDVMLKALSLGLPRTRLDIAGPRPGAYVVSATSEPA